MTLPSLVEAGAAFQEARQRLLAIHRETMRGSATHLDLALAVKACADAEDLLQRVLASYATEPPPRGGRPN
jgi:hypothetical protein